jgi:hypothetical protein
VSISKLDPKIFDKDVEQEAIRKGLGEGLLQAGKENHYPLALMLLTALTIESTPIP